MGGAVGQCEAGALRALITDSNATHIRVTPWRMLHLENAKPLNAIGFLRFPDPLLDVSACPGAPACAQSTVITRDLARRLAPQVLGSLHVSGCAKGCARRTVADVTLVLSFAVEGLLFWYHLHDVSPTCKATLCNNKKRNLSPTCLACLSPTTLESIRLLAVCIGTGRACNDAAPAPYNVHRRVYSMHCS